MLKGMCATAKIYLRWLRPVLDYHNCSILPVTQPEIRQTMQVFPTSKSAPQAIGGVKAVQVERKRHVKYNGSTEITLMKGEDHEQFTIGIHDGLRSLSTAEKLHVIGA